MSTDEEPGQSTARSSEKTSIGGRQSFVEMHDVESNADGLSSAQTQTHQLNAKLENPLALISREQLLADAAMFASTHDLAEYTDTIQKGALVAQDPAAIESLPMLADEDRRALRREFTHKWDQPRTLYYLVILCSIAAAVGGVCLLPIPH